MLYRSVVEKSVVDKSVVENYWREVLQRRVGEKWRRAF